MSHIIRKIGFESATLEDKIKSEDEDSIVFPAVIAREMVQPYRDGKAYKPADELEQAGKTANRAFNGYLPVIYGGHPDFSNGYQGLLIRSDDVKGRTENIRFAKDLKDPKTGRPMDRGIRADIRFFKKDLTADQLTELKMGIRRDVSIGFVYDEDRTPGTWRNQPYDFVQRNMFLQHVAAGVPIGRCPGPYCGIGIDELQEVNTMSEKTGLDKVVKRGDQWCVVHCHGEEEGEAIKCFNTKEEAEAMHRAIQANQDSDDDPPFADYENFADCTAKNQDKDDPDAYCAEIKRQALGDQGSRSDVERAKAHFNISDEDWEKLSDEEKQAYLDKLPPRGSADCPLCTEMERLGTKRFAAKLARVFGADILKQLFDAETKTEFMERCQAEGGSVEDCEAKWLEQHPEASDQARTCGNCHYYFNGICEQNGMAQPSDHICDLDKFEERTIEGAEVTVDQVKRFRNLLQVLA